MFFSARCIRGQAAGVFAGERLGTRLKQQDEQVFAMNARSGDLAPMMTSGGSLVGQEVAASCFCQARSKGSNRLLTGS